MDLEYIDKWSLWLDFKILVRTVWTVIAGSGS
jgi:lipopolysaccharide/colanic/teichoic acid biosynthesis glycosyltransferase